MVAVNVIQGNIEQALRYLKKKMQREGLFREMKLRRHYEKPPEKKKRKRDEAMRRHRKTRRRNQEE